MTILRVNMVTEIRIMKPFLTNSQRTPKKFSSQTFFSINLIFEKISH